MGRGFGTMLRALRLGYRWVERLRRYVRVRDADDGAGVLVDLTDGAAFPERRGALTYRAWWEDPGVLDMSPYLAALTPETAPRVGTVRLDEDGRLAGVSP